MTPFQRQEQVMFDLLFDAALRAHFLRDRVAALAPYALTPEAQQDFDAIRADALVLDARMRADLMLATISKVLPLSFSVVSSCAGGLELLRGLLDTRTMRAHPAERALTFATHLREQLRALAWDSENESHLIATILDAERGMASTSAALKRAVVEVGVGEIQPPPLASDWVSQPVQLAEYVSANILPMSYQEMKKTLCIADGAGLWRELNRSPVPAEKRRAMLSQPDPRLLVSRAWVSQFSMCDPVVEHRTMELSEGFAALFQYVNGTLSIEDILSGLSSAGAPTNMLEGVGNGFRQLLEAGMLALVD